MLTAAPGTRLLEWAEVVFSPKTVTRLLEPAIADLRTEYFEKLAAGANLGARVALIRGYWSFWSAIGAHVGVSSFSKIVAIWKLFG